MNIEREEILNNPYNANQEDFDQGMNGIQEFSDFAAFAKEQEENEEEPQFYTEEHPQEQEEFYMEETNQFSDYELKKRKGDALGELRRFKENGVSVSPHLNMNSTLDELETEVICLKQKIKRQGTLEMSRAFLIAGVAFIEGASAKYDPYTPLLGWKDAFSGTITNYDDVLMRVYERYGFDTDNMDPLILLLAMVTMSGFSHVMTSKSSSALPKFATAMENLKKDATSGVSGPSDEAMDLFNQINSEEPKPKRKYNKKKN